MNLSTFFNSTLIKPDLLDGSHFEYKGIKFHVYGILHGLTGGTNQEYVNLINRTIAQSNGIIMAEKSMKKIYIGIDEEVDDWLQMPILDTIKLTFNLFKSPFRFYNVFKLILKEKLTRKDKFNTNFPRLQDLGGSPYFHLLDRQERRKFLGFNTSSSYFDINLKRRGYLHNNFKITPISFIDEDYFWLSYIEPYANIPFRSIHMIEYAVAKSKLLGKDEVSLFIGETHGSDIEWYVNTAEHSPEHIQAFHDIIKTSDYYIKQENKIKLWFKKMNYLLGITIGFSCSLCLYFIYFYFMTFAIKFF